MIVNSSQGGGSKDTWVLEDGDARRRPRRPADRRHAAAGLPDLRYGGWHGQPSSNSRPASSRLAARRRRTAEPALMLARIAQELFWLGRDLTRAEFTARMLDGAFHADVAGVQGHDSAGSRSGVSFWPDRRQARSAIARRRAATSRRHARPGASDQLTLDAELRRARRSTAASIVACTRGSARTLRDVITPRCGRRSTRSTCARAATTCSPALRRPARTRSTRRSRSAARCSGDSPTVDAARRGEVLPRGRRPDRDGRHGAADAARGDARAPPAERRTPRLGAGRRRRADRCCRRSAASTPTGAPSGRPRRPSRSARFLLFERAYPDSVARLRATRCTRSSRPPTPGRATRKPVLRVSRLAADLDFQRRALAATGRADRDLRTDPAGARP